MDSAQLEQDLAQLKQMVDWLDEEHRRDRNEIVRLSHLVETQSAELADRTKQIQELEASLSRAESPAPRIQQFEAALDKTRQEFAALHEREEEQRQRMQRDWERARISDRDQLRREMSELQRELARINQLEQAGLLRDEDVARAQETANEVKVQVAGISAEVSELAQHVPFLMENKSSEQKRMRQLQEDQVEHFKRIEEVVQAVSRLSEDYRKVRAEFPDLHNGTERVQRNVDALREEFKNDTYDLSHRLRTFDTSVQELAPRFEGLETQLNALIPFQDSAQKALTEVRQLNQRMDQGLQQMRETERMFQLKVEKTLKEADDAETERNRKSRMQQEHIGQEQESLRNAMQERFLLLQQNLRLHEELIKQLWKLHETYPQMALKAAQEGVENMHNFVRERDRIMRSLEDEWTHLRRHQELYAGNGQLAPRNAPQA